MLLRPENAVSPPLPDEDLRHVLKHTRGLWDEARGGAFFITGGTGFFGMWLVESLLFINSTLELGLRIVVLSRDPNRLIAKAPHLGADTALALIEGDIRSFDFPSGEFKYVIHAAASVHGANSPADRLLLLDEMVGGTRRVCEFAKRANCRNLLLTSSGAVYGNRNSDVGYGETDLGMFDPLCQTSTYAWSKSISEHIATLECQSSGTDLKIARGFSFLGPHLPLNGQFAIGNFIRDVISGETIKVAGDGTAVRSYLYAADLAIWLWVILFRGPGGRAYNVGSSREVSISALANLVARELKSPFDVQIAQTANPNNPSNFYFPKTERASSELGLTEHITLEDAIDRTARWYSAPTSLNSKL